MNKYLAECDDFYVNVNLNTEMELPTSRDTVLHFFEQMKKRSPTSATSTRARSGDLVLEGDKEQESYRCLAIEPRRLCSGHVNPETLDDAYRQHEMVLELAPHLLTISVLDCEALDVMYGFDFDYEGNHDEVVAEALGVGPAFEGLAEVPAVGVLNFEPSITHGARRVVPAPGPALDRDPDQRLPGPHRRVRRRPDQRLLHGPPVLGQRPRPHVPRLVPAPARDRRGDRPGPRRPPDRPPAGPGDRVAILIAGVGQHADRPHPRRSSPMPRLSHLAATSRPRPRSPSWRWPGP